MPDQAAAVCVDCGAPINPHAARYRGVTRCRSCAAKRRGITLPPFTSETAAAAGRRRAAEYRRLQALERRLREQGEARPSLSTDGAPAR